MFKLRECDLDKLNSLTKYPSIPTYHALGEKGVLTDTIQVPFSDSIYGTEKIDGTNVRVILTPDGHGLLGSREDLLWADGDLIGNPSMGIVEGMKDIFPRLLRDLVLPYALTVAFLEFFGRNVGAGAKNYSKQATGFRLFDLVLIRDYEDLLNLSREGIAHWRENGGQDFVLAGARQTWATVALVPEVPFLFAAQATDLPTTHEGVMGLLTKFKDSYSVLDATGLGKMEGIVVRSADRKQIAKLRFEDYERSLRKRKS